MGAPTSEDVLKATAVHGATGLDVTLRMLESASAEHVPYDVLKVQPHWFNQQIADYLEEFVGAPAPDPLESWRAARRKARAGRGRGRGVGGRASGEGRRRAGGSSGAGLLILLARSGELEIHAAKVGRFYGDGLRWALALPLSGAAALGEPDASKITERERGG